MTKISKNNQVNESGEMYDWSHMDMSNHLTFSHEEYMMPKEPLKKRIRGWFWVNLGIFFCQSCYKKRMKIFSFKREGYFCSRKCFMSVVDMMESALRRKNEQS